MWGCSIFRDFSVLIRKINIPSYRHCHLLCTLTTGLNQLLSVFNKTWTYASWKAVIECLLCYIALHVIYHRQIILSRQWAACFYNPEQTQIKIGSSPLNLIMQWYSLQFILSSHVALTARVSALIWVFFCFSKFLFLFMIFDYPCS